jgi:ribosomal-protein-alanine N-acetyltransferase
MVGQELSGLLIEDMKEADLPEVAALEKSAFTTPWSEISFFNELKNPRSLMKVGRKGSIIAGYACAHAIVDEGHILTVATHPEFRRQGVASSLVARVIEELQEGGCRFIFLEVRASNEAARRMYERFGFQVFGIRKGYYAEPREDAAVMLLKKES